MRYEDLRGNPEAHLGGVLSALGMSAGTDALRRAVRSNAWENVPKEKKGAGKFYRRATPGGWREDLTPEQANTVERIAAPLLAEFYPET